MKKTMLKMHFICVIIFAQLLYRAVGQTPDFLYEPANTEVRAGEEGKLQCVLSNNRDGSNCFWSRNEQEVIIEETGRYAFTGDRSRGDCSISISSSIYTFDDGLWACGLPHTSDVVGIKSHSAKYTVLSPPNPPVIRVDGQQRQNGSEIEIIMGQTDMDLPISPKIECLSEGGNPVASLVWNLQNGQELQGNYTVSYDAQNKSIASVLLLTETPNEDWSDKYLACVASHGAYDQNAIAYGVIKMPNPTTWVTIKTMASGESPDIQVNPDDVVTVTCDTNGYPPPEIKLQKNTQGSDEWEDILNSNCVSTNVCNFTFSGIEAQIQCAASQDSWVTTITSPTPVNIVVQNPSSAAIGTIIAIVVVCIVAVVIMGAGVFACYKKKMCVFKVPDPVEKKANDGQKGPKDVEVGEQENKEPLLSEVNKNQHQFNGNQKPDSPPTETPLDDGTVYSELQFNKSSKPNPVNEQRTEYATIKPRH